MHTAACAIRSGTLQRMHPYTTFVALGDSFTEGLDDPGPDGMYRGWADLVAARLAAEAPGFT
jgi:lysophospholipase L1-like esterase